MRETNQTDKLGRSGEPDKQTKIVRRSNRQIRLFVSVCLVTTLTGGLPAYIEPLPPRLSLEDVVCLNRKDA